jgi:hypothetical protein
VRLRAANDDPRLAASTHDGDFSERVMRINRPFAIC